jgi:RNA polymerase sigma-70 factor (ECF subfamily)
VQDIELARAASGGDGHAFRLLVERETPSVFRTCYRILGRIDDAEDAVQDTFVAAYRSINAFRGDGSASAWLARIATRECWRRAASSRRLNAATTFESAAADAHDPSDPLGETLAAEQREQVRRAVLSLPEPYREVIALRFFSELSLIDIAIVTGRPEGTVKSQLHRGLDRLRQGLSVAVTA